MADFNLPFDNASLRSVEAGDVIFLEGQPADKAYVILRGHADVVVVDPTTCNLIPLTTMNPGELFGELALLNADNKRTATVMAKDRCELLEIDREVFDARMSKADPLLRFVLEHLTRRLAHLTNKIVIDHGK